MASFMFHSEEELAQRVEEFGILPFFAHDIPNFSVEEFCPNRLWFTGVEGPWDWKGPVIKATHCAYGKFFRKKAAFISKRWFLDFANYRRDGYDFDARFQDGLASYEDQYLYNTLTKHEPCTTKTLKAYGNYRKEKKGYDTSITRLQMQGYVTIADFEYPFSKKGEVYGWGMGLLMTPERYYGKSFTSKVYQRTPEESKIRLLRHLRKICPYSSEEDLLRFLG